MTIVDIDEARRVERALAALRARLGKEIELGRQGAAMSPEHIGEEERAADQAKAALSLVLLAMVPEFPQDERTKRLMAFAACKEAAKACEAAGLDWVIAARHHDREAGSGRSFADARVSSEPAMPGWAEGYDDRVLLDLLERAKDGMRRAEEQQRMDTGA